MLYLSQSREPRISDIRNISNASILELETFYFLQRGCNDIAEEKASFVYPPPRTSNFRKGISKCGEDRNEQEKHDYNYLASTHALRHRTPRTPAMTWKQETLEYQPKAGTWLFVVI